MKKFWLFVVWLFLAVPVFSQVAKPTAIVKTIPKKGYYYIPEVALSDSVAAVLWQIPSVIGRNTIRKQFEFFWQTDCINGTYHLTITPEQILYTSGNYPEHPQPNFLFWMQPIGPGQYKRISKMLRRKPPGGYKDLSAAYPDKHVFFDQDFDDGISPPTSRERDHQHAFYNFCELIEHQQLEKLYQILNTSLPEKEKLTLPSQKEIYAIRSKFFSPDEEELNQWLKAKTY